VPAASYGRAGLNLAACHGRGLGSAPVTEAVPLWLGGGAAGGHVEFVIRGESPVFYKALLRACGVGRNPLRKSEGMGARRPSPA
jgi:hypothetical protein